ncbi:MAG: mechanosensitive ion channel family protein, partial [Pyrinomonadaceae bacterium]
MSSLFLLLYQQTPPAPAAPKTPAQVFEELYTRFGTYTLVNIINCLFVFAVFIVVAWVGKRVIAHAAPRVKADTGAVLLLSRVYYYGILIFGLLTALPATGLDVSALIAGLGLTGFALGFALKDVLSNLVAGIMLLLYRPFRIGDQIKMGEFEGTIVTIRMRDTLVRAYD